MCYLCQHGNLMVIYLLRKYGVHVPLHNFFFENGPVVQATLRRSFGHFRNTAYPIPSDPSLS